MKNFKFKFLLILLCCFALFVLSFNLILAYTFLQPLPDDGDFLTSVDGDLLSTYLTWLYRFMLGAAAFLALIKIVIGGAYVILGGASENAQSKGREMVEMALWGLLLAVTSWLILNSINPDLVKGTFELPEITVTVKSPAPAPSGPPAEFNNSASPELSGFISCIKNSVPGLIITSTTDNNIARGLCNPTDPSENFKDPNNCQHTKYSCHYGGSNSNCISKGSYAIDVGNNINGKIVAKAAAQCGGVMGNYSVTAKCILNENGNHHHISIGAWYSCGCDTGVATCASQE